jgi:hypothetical protein
LPICIERRKEAVMSRKMRVPKPVYYQCVWILKDIERLKRLEAVDNYRSSKDEFVVFVDEEEVIRNAEVLCQARFKLECIRKALLAVPEDYRQMTIDSIVYGLSFGDMAHENTWRRWRQIFIRELAGNLNLI